MLVSPLASLPSDCLCRCARCGRLVRTCTSVGACWGGDWSRILGIWTWCAQGEGLEKLVVVPPLEEGNRQTLPLPLPLPQLQLHHVSGCGECMDGAGCTGGRNPEWFCQESRSQWHPISFHGWDWSCDIWRWSHFWEGVCVDTDRDERGSWWANKRSWGLLTVILHSES